MMPVTKDFTMKSGDVVLIGINDASQIAGISIYTVDKETYKVQKLSDLTEEFKHWVMKETALTWESLTT